MLVPNRNYQSPEYRYGFNGMEADDEIKGFKNSYTTHFRQYDPRVGRWHSTDPVIKKYISPYNSMSNTPLIRVDPRGDDDYFDIIGNYLGSDDKSTNNIIILRDLIGAPDDLFKWSGSDFIINSEKAIDYNYTDLMSFNYNFETNRQMLHKVGDYYIEKLGIKGKSIRSVSNVPNSLMYVQEGSFPTTIFLSIVDGFISKYLNDAFNFQNSIVHENDHFNGLQEDELEHTNRYLSTSIRKFFKF